MQSSATMRTRGSTTASEFLFPFKVFHMTVHLWPSLFEVVGLQKTVTTDCPELVPASNELSRLLISSIHGWHTCIRALPRPQELPPTDKVQGSLSLRDDAVRAGSTPANESFLDAKTHQDHDLQVQLQVQYREEFAT
ncbi:hypothetical protein C8F01DRAFT_1077724 [Mycena amicta]|nr:hypothetical protein C8F01DRAFT_1077724 [Mycena amicta]